MADPLFAAAETFAPAPAGRNLFDPTQAGDIISYYANARRGEDAARQRLQDAAAMDRVEKDRTLWDRQTIQFQEEDDFKRQRGELLEALAGLDPAAEDYETQMSGFLQTMPDIAGKDDAVQALIKVKEGRYQDLLRLRQQEQLDQRRQREADARAANTVRRSMSAAGIDTTPFVDSATGNFDIDGALAAYARREANADIAKQREKEELERSRADARVFSKDPYTLDVVRAGDLPAAEELFQGRLKNSTLGSLPDDITGKVFEDTEDAFVTRVQDFAVKRAEEAAKASRDIFDEDAAKAARNAAEGPAKAIYSAARGVSMLRRQNPTIAPAEAPKKPSSLYLDNLFRSVETD